MLYKKKPCADSKTVKEVLGDEGGKEVEFSVMVLGYTASTATPSSAADAGGESSEGKVPDGADWDVKMEDVSLPVAPGTVSGVQVLRTQEFWNDLKGFLTQRVRDQGVAEEAAALFEEVWREKGER